MLTSINDSSIEFPKYLDDLCEAWEPVGSRVTCSPPPTDTDQDFLVLVAKDKLSVFTEELTVNKWTKEGGKEKEKFPDRDTFPDGATGFDQYLKAVEEYHENESTYGTLGDGSSFNSWRKGEINLILTLSEDWYDKFMEASDCCKALNVLDKAKRVEIFAKIVPKELPKTKGTFLVDTANLTATQMEIQPFQPGMWSPVPNQQHVFLSSIWSSPVNGVSQLLPQTGDMFDET